METEFLSVTLAYGNQSSRIGMLFKEVTFVMKPVNSIQVGLLPGKLELSIWISRYLQSDMKRIKSIISPWYSCCLWCFIKQLPCSKPCVCPAALRNVQVSCCDVLITISWSRWRPSCLYALDIFYLYFRIKGCFYFLFNKKRALCSVTLWFLYLL